MQNHLLKIFDPLSEASLPEKQMFLEASAGTGKTFAIEHIVCRLILQGIPLDEILITTFTRAGARDLKKRIAANLLKTLTALQKGGIAYLEALENPISGYLSVKRALQLIDEAEIHTIHSFCHKMLSQFAFEAKIDLHMKPLEDTDYQEALSIAILDQLRILQDDSEFSPAQMLSLLAPYHRDLSKYQKKMARFLEGDPRLPDLPPYRLHLEKFHTLLDAIDLNQLDLISILPNYKRSCDRGGNIHSFFLEQIEALTKRNFEALLKASPSIADILQKSNLKLGKEHKLPEKFDRLLTLIQEASNPTSLFLRMAKKVQTAVKKKNLSGPSELLETMLERLKEPLFFQKVSQKFRACIIDEFQDTDPVQWGIFYSLFFDRAELFLVVGDPKQSIYAFRGANLSTYLDAKKLFPDRHALTTNYRSQQSLIEKLNILFDESFTPGLFTFEQNPSLAYQKISAGKKSESIHFQDSLHFVFFEDAKGRSSQWPTPALEEEKILPFLLQELHALPSLHSVAILVKDRYQASKISDFLSQHNIPNITSATSSLIETKMFSLLELGLRLALKPRDLSILKQFLAHPYIHWPLEKLRSGLEDPDLQSIVAIFVALKKKLKEEGIAHFLRAFLDASFPHEPLIHTLVKDHDAYCDLQGLTRIFLEETSDSLLNTLSKLKNMDPEKHPHLKRKVLVEGDAVKILTSHMSKGLEFDVVFALGIASRSKETSDFVKTEDGSQAVFHEEDPACQRALIELDKEKIRLLYVSFTRAKEKLYVICPINTEEKELALGSSSPLELFLARLGKPFLSYTQTYAAISSLNFRALHKTLSDVGIPCSLVSAPEKISSRSKTHSPSLTPPIELPPLPKRGPILSFSSLPHEHTPLHLPPDPNSLPSGSETGSHFHLLFEKMIETGMYFDWEEEKIKAFLAKELEFTLLQPWLDDVFDLVQTAFFTPLSTFALKNVPPQNMAQELSFLYPQGDARMKGFTDLVFFMEGKYYILDWKLNRLPSYDPTSLHEAMENNNYYTQASIYKKALQSFIEFKYDAPFNSLFGGMFYFFLRGKEKGLLHLY